MAGEAHAGEALKSPDIGVRKVTFSETASTVKILSLDRSKAYDVFLAVAGNTNILLQSTMDSPEAVANGTANYAALKTFAATSAGGYLVGSKKGVTAIKVTQSKQGASADNSVTVAALGGRAQVRAVPNDGTLGDSGNGSYTALTSS